MGVQGRHHLIERLDVRLIASIDGDVGNFIQGITGLDVFFEHFDRVPVFEQGAVRAVGHALGQHLDVGFQPEGNGLGLEIFTGEWVSKRAAAGGQNARFPLQQAGDDTLFAVTESFSP